LKEENQNTISINDKNKINNELFSIKNKKKSIENDKNVKDSNSSKMFNEKQNIPNVKQQTNENTEVSNLIKMKNIENVQDDKDSSSIKMIVFNEKTSQKQLELNNEDNGNIEIDKKNSPIDKNVDQLTKSQINKLEQRNKKEQEDEDEEEKNSKLKQKDSKNVRGKYLKGIRKDPRFTDFLQKSNRPFIGYEIKENPKNGK
jgi:hypothetical protein